MLDRVTAIAHDTRFSGVVRVDADGEAYAEAFGFADRGHAVPNTVGTRFGIASAVKGFTALTAVRLVIDGVLAIDAPVRPLLGADLPLVDDAVTIGHLLSHRSGIGDYLDEEADGEITDHVMPIPVHRLASTEDYLAVIDGFPQRFAPGTAFAYNNGGYVVLALLCERAAGTPFADLVARHVTAPAGMTSTAFVRTDELPGDLAIGYLHAEGLRTNALHLPVLGSGDGGISSTAADIHAFWAAFSAGRIVPDAWVRDMTTPRSVGTSNRGFGCGLGFWIGARNAVLLEGYDAGVSFRSAHDPVAGWTYTVIGNWSDAAWPIVRHLDAHFGVLPAA